MGHIQPPPLARWSPARDAWETEEVSLLCGHSGVFSETWPSSGSMRNGAAFERPTWAPATSGDECSSSLGTPRDSLPTPRTSDTNGVGAHGTGGLDLRTVVDTLPTPSVTDMGRDKTPAEWDEWTAAMKVRHGNGNGHGVSLHVEARRASLPTPTTQPNTGNGHARNLGAEVKSLIPTPSVADAMGGHERRGGKRGAELLLPGVAKQLLPAPTGADSKASGSHGYGGNEFCTLTDATVRQPDRWGQYAAAIARHEHALGRPAPEPTIPAKRGGRKLSGEFTEWMMMQPHGWIWDLVLDGTITNNEALKLCGNGVVTPQAVYALRLMLPHVPRGTMP